MGRGRVDKCTEVSAPKPHSPEHQNVSCGGEDSPEGLPQLGEARWHRGGGGNPTRLPGAKSPRILGGSGARAGEALRRQALGSLEGSDRQGAHVHTHSSSEVQGLQEDGDLSTASQLHATCSSDLNRPFLFVSII